NSPKHNTSFHSDAFLAEFDRNSPNLLFSAYLGGTNDDVGVHLLVDTNNSDHVYVTGYTFSKDFPTTVVTAQPEPANPFIVPDLGTNLTIIPDPGTNFISHVFVMEFNNDGSIAASTQFGGNLADQASGIAVDNNGLTYITGVAASTNFFP